MWDNCLLHCGKAFRDNADWSGHSYREGTLPWLRRLIYPVAEYRRSGQVAGQNRVARQVCHGAKVTGRADGRAGGRKLAIYIVNGHIDKYGASVEVNATKKIKEKKKSKI